MFGLLAGHASTGRDLWSLPDLQTQHIYGQTSFPAKSFSLLTLGAMILNCVETSTAREICMYSIQANTMHMMCEESYEGTTYTFDRHFSFIAINNDVMYVLDSSGKRVFML